MYPLSKDSPPFKLKEIKSAKSNPFTIAVLGVEICISAD